MNVEIMLKETGDSGGLGRTRKDTTAALVPGRAEFAPGIVALFRRRQTVQVEELNALKN